MCPSQSKVSLRATDVCSGAPAARPSQPAGRSVGTSRAGLVFFALLLVVAGCGRAASPGRSGTGGTATTPPAMAPPSAVPPAPVAAAGAEVCDGRDNDGDGDIDEDVPTDGAGCRRPDPPAFPAVVGTLTVAVRTGTGQDDGTKENQLSVCVTETGCFDLDVAGVDDFQRGAIDVYHFENVGIARGDVDRFQLRSVDGVDHWDPTAAAMQFDGEPVYCREGISVKLGNEAGEVESWTDPEGVSLGCRSIYPSLLTHGPLLGAVSHDRAHVWARTDATRPVSLRIGRTPQASESDSVLWRYPASGNDYTAHFEVLGLQPDQAYYYQVVVDGVPSERHAFTTAPPEGAPTQLHFAFGSCARFDEQPVFRRITDLQPDLFLFVGDNHYADTDDLGALRWFYRWSRERPDRAALVKGVPTLAIWDDHDFTGDNTTGSEPGKATALRVFREYWANGASGTSDLEGIFFTHRHGDVEFFLVDDRYYRGFSGTLLGPGQTDWLYAALEASTATFKFVVSGSQFNPHGSSDSWAAWSEASQALFDRIRDSKIEGVVLLSGDVHFSEFRIIDRSGDGGYDLPELTSSPLAADNLPCWTDAGSLSCFDEGVSFIEVRLDTTLADPTIRATIYDGEGSPRDVWTIPRSALEFDD